jgi:GNAT superfamily N-acetyltransferase
MKIIEIFESISDFSKQMMTKYDLTSFYAYENGDQITLSMIEVPKVNRKQGIGTSVMTDLINYADEHQKRIVLTPGLHDPLHGTTSRARLIKFYKRFGFVENRGRNKDFSISELMYREPK